MDNTLVHGIIGPMYSGKSSFLLKEIESLEELPSQSCVIYKPASDTRYGNDIVSTHSRKTAKAISVDFLMDVIDSTDFKDATVIGIDEAQFFEDLASFIKVSMKKGKAVIFAGLSGTIYMEPWKSISEAISLCTKLNLLQAYCTRCNNRTLAEYTSFIDTRTTINESTKLIGAKETYVAVCFKHWQLLMFKNPEIQKRWFKV